MQFKNTLRNNRFGRVISNRIKSKKVHRREETTNLFFSLTVLLLKSKTGAYL